MQVEGMTFKDIEILLPQGRSGVVASVELAGNIGICLLTDFRVIFDYPRQRIVFYPADR
jgi:hypothetical protein